jgi:hypothetical protein
VQFGVSRPSRVFRVVRSVSPALPLLGAFSLTALTLPLASAGLDQIPNAAAHLASRAHAAVAAAQPDAAESALSPASVGAAPQSVPLEAAVVLTANGTSDTSVSGMISDTFGPYAAQALAVAQCESSLDPWATNPSSDAAGVFQFLASTWAGTSYAGDSRYDAWANIHAAHEIFVRDGYSWREWSCQP